MFKKNVHLYTRACVQKECTLVQSYMCAKRMYTCTIVHVCKKNVHLYNRTCVQKECTLVQSYMCAKRMYTRLLSCITTVGQDCFFGGYKFMILISLAQIH